MNRVFILSWFLCIGLTIPLFGQKINGLSFVASNDSMRAEYLKPVLEVHANFVSLMPYGYTVDKASTTIHFNSKRQWFGEQLKGVQQYADAFKKSGVKIMMKPHLWVRGSFTGDLTMSSESDWKKLEASYEAFMLTFAKSAEQMQAPILCIGTELESFVMQRQSYWKMLIKKIRKVYSGKLTYAANWDEFSRFPFWDQLDYIGIDAYFPLTTMATPSVLDFEKGWVAHKEQIQKVQRRVKKPVLFTEYGYRSVNYAGKKPWDYSNAIGQVNFMAQKNGLQAIYNQFWHEEWFAGGFIWKWFMWHDRVGGVKNNRFTPQNKPAEALLKTLYKQ